MITSWYYAHDGAKKGPVSRNDLQLALNLGEIDRQTLVWCEGMTQWQALESVEDLQPLLEQVPPPLPDSPPPLPAPESASPAAADSADADPDDRGGHGDDRSQADRRRPGKVREIGERWFVKTVEWLADKIGNLLWEKYFGKPAVVFIFLPSLVVGVVVTVNHLRPKEPANPSGQIRIDANPWGEVGWIRGPGGRKIDLPEVRTTPLVLTLPVGAYQAQVDYPHARASKRCDLQVQPGRLATCWLDLAPVDAASYFQRIGW